MVVPSLRELIDRERLGGEPGYAKDASSGTDQRTRSKLGFSGEEVDAVAQFIARATTTGPGTWPGAREEARAALEASGVVPRAEHERVVKDRVQMELMRDDTWAEIARIREERDRWRDNTHHAIRERNAARAERNEARRERDRAVADSERLCREVGLLESVNLGDIVAGERAAYRRLRAAAQAVVDARAALCHQRG